MSLHTCNGDGVRLYVSIISIWPDVAGVGSSLPHDLWDYGRNGVFYHVHLSLVHSFVSTGCVRAPCVAL